uniref:hypothetical protein n=1 Tax=Faecalibacterium sp. TaxID=1971605 RepID=UPI004026E205
MLLMPGGVGVAVQAARFAGGLGVACCVLGSVRRGLSHHKDGCSVYRSGCWCVGGLIVGVVVAAPGGACGRLPVRARSCWVRGCGRAGGSLLA